MTVIWNQSNVSSFCVTWTPLFSTKINKIGKFVGFFIFRDMDTVILDQGMYYVVRLAQLVERGTFNPEVEGSIPSSGVI
ncbi:hypothetical protein OUZ56_023293 [Daphnia magna]|uniref:Uncharacterized protein n=1 Tax=Daphnia magna TaxID=35525 RepID=A0ABR0AYU1_9CRUS|nr:hypothetical protein OUZ56_023293 [Daphnia magna]